MVLATTGVPMDVNPGATSARFGDLLRQHRVAASLTQENLAERAGLSTRGISDLERGARTHPYRETVAMLAGALSLAGPERAAFFSAARRRTRVAAPRRLAGVAAPLPVPMNKLIDRQADVAAVSGLLTDEHVRLVTLTGPGGVGKTRLALAVAEQVNGAFAGGKIFVDLAPLQHPSGVSTAIATALGLPERTGGLRESLQRALGERRLLLVLDNYEHVLEAALVVSDLLHAVDGVKALVTSREALRLHGERAYPVPPLGLPPPSREGRAEALTASGAVRLFVERATEADPRFALTDDNAADVAAICRRLDGLPLAIELAAARITFLPLPALLERLEQRLPLLTGGRRDAPARQRTLRNAIAWSFDLLDPDEQALFAGLGLFSGGWSLAAAEAILGGQAGRDVLELLASLVDKSLVWRASGAEESRFSMLETIREFALERLREHGEQERWLREAHARYFQALAEDARLGLVGAEQERWLMLLDAEAGNLATALAWTLEHGDPDDGLRFTRALWRYWAPRGQLVAGRVWLEMALARANDGADNVARADAHNALGNLLGDIGDYALARHQFEQALVLRRALGDADGVAGALNNLGIIAYWLGDYDAATKLHDESLSIRRSLHDHFGEALSISNLGDVASARGDLAAARQFQLDALRLREQVRDAVGCAYSYYNLGEIARLGGDLPEAARLLGLSLERFGRLGDRLGTAYAEWSLAEVASVAGEAERAADFLERALETRIEIGDQRGVVECLEGAGLIALRLGRERDGIPLLAAAYAGRKELACPLPPSSRDHHERSLAPPRARLGARRVDALLADSPLTPEQARGLARQVIDQIISGDQGPSREFA